MSIIQEGPGFPLLLPGIYEYMVSGNIAEIDIPDQSTVSRMRVSLVQLGIVLIVMAKMGLLPDFKFLQNTIPLHVMIGLDMSPNFKRGEALSLALSL